MHQKSASFNLGPGMECWARPLCADWAEGHLRSGSPMQVGETIPFPGMLCWANRAGRGSSLGGWCWSSWDLWGDKEKLLIIAHMGLAEFPIDTNRRAVGKG